MNKIIIASKLMLFGSKKWHEINNDLATLTMVQPKSLTSAILNILPSNDKCTSKATET